MGGNAASLWASGSGQLRTHRLGVSCSPVRGTGHFRDSTCPRPPHTLNPHSESNAATWASIAILFWSSSISLGTFRVNESHRNPPPTKVTQQCRTEACMAVPTARGQEGNRMAGGAPWSTPPPPRLLGAWPSRRPYSSLPLTMVNSLPRLAFLPDLGT